MEQGSGLPAHGSGAAPEPTPPQLSCVSRCHSPKCLYCHIFPLHWGIENNFGKARTAVIFWAAAWAVCWLSVSRTTVQPLVVNEVGRSDACSKNHPCEVHEIVDFEVYVVFVWALELNWIPFSPVCYDRLWLLAMNLVTKSITDPHNVSVPLL